MRASVERHFTSLVGALSLAYAFIAGSYVKTLPLVMDEFQGGAAVYQFGAQIPYRDFQPYKTVLGYYFELLPFSLAHGVWPRLMAVKWALVGANAIAVIAATFWMSRRFSKGAILAATPLLLCMSTFLERSAELRVDMLTAIGGLFSLLALLDRRYAVAGALAAVSFLTSQKGAYYVVASAAAFAAVWAADGWNRRHLYSGLIFAGTALAVLSAYVLFFAAYSSIDTVISTTIASGARAALGDAYGGLRWYWLQTFRRNPYFWIAAVVGLVVLARRAASRRDQTAALLAGYGITLFALCAWHKQPWPYFFVLLIPTAWVLITALFDTWLRDGWKPSLVAVALYALLGIAWPLMRVPVVLARDNGFQRQMVDVAEQVLRPDETYFAGVNLVFTHRQPPMPLEWLDQPRLREVAAMDLETIVERLQDARPALLVWNYRLDALPPLVREYLQRHYARWYGSLWVHSPTVEAGQQDFEMYLDGTCTLPSDESVIIDDAAYLPNGEIGLGRGRHRSRSSHAFRLICGPTHSPAVLPKEFSGPATLFPDVYNY